MNINEVLELLQPGEIEAVGATAQRFGLTVPEFIREAIVEHLREQNDYDIALMQTLSQGEPLR